jgi:outer membrane protein OmpA-like peptidoglycan-associated protein
LDKHILSRLKQNPDAIVEVGSHTDSRGSSATNQNLSERRSKSVVEYLNQKGIKTSRMIAVGYGESHLLNNCKDGVDCSEKKHAKNRRTEFKFF